MKNNVKKSSEAGKGDQPRNCFSERYRTNYDLIKWFNKKNKNTKKSK